MSQQHLPSEIELEYTYLAAYLPKELADVAPVRLVDVYIPEHSGAHPHMRVRQKGNVYEITKKIPLKQGDASVMVEQTIPLDEVEFDHLRQVSPLTVVKDRYNVTIDGFPAEVDVFQDRLSGLVLIDFEFSTIEEKDAFSPPSVCLADVTQEDVIAGGLLAGKAFADIEKQLARFGYTAIIA